MTTKLILFNILSLLLLITTLIHDCSTQCLTDNDQEQLLNPTARTDLYRGEQAFSISLLDSINKATPNENVFFSPYSTYHALLLAYFGSRNATEKELSNVLNLKWATNKHHVMQAYRLETRMRASRSKSSSVEFVAADKIFVSKSAELKECMKSFFNDELETMNFEKEPEKCRLEINAWVEQITRNEIKDILMPGDITSETNLVLANAAYFKGQWASKFDPINTTQEIFYSSSEKRSFVDMMYKNGTFNLGVSEQLGAHVLELPYLGESGDISMIIFLPPFVPNGIDNILNKLTPETLKQAIQDGLPREIEVKLPKFTFEKTLKLVPILQNMGINTLFGPNADLSAFSNTTKLSLGDALHKAKIQVDEEGSTAAAATLLFTFRSARPVEPTKFICDHPFLFLIYDHRASAVLFAGIYRGPDQ